jgi:hypothetical protein
LFLNLEGFFGCLFDLFVSHLFVFLGSSLPVDFLGFLFYFILCLSFFLLVLLLWVSQC